VDLHLDGGHVEVLNGHVDFEEWLDQEWQKDVSIVPCTKGT
jgi:hypothetical protein